MQGRTGLLPSAITACAVAVATIPLLTLGGVAKAESCLAAPKAPSPQGSHWYYRIERPSLRKCWHLAAKDQKTQSAAAPASPQPDLDKPDEPATALAVSTPAANAPAASTPAEPAVPVIRNLVTRNVSNTDDAAQPAPPPDPSANVPPRAETPNAPAAPVQPMTSQPATPVVAEHPVVQAATAPEKAAVSSLGGGPSLFLLLAALGVLAGAAFLVMGAMRRSAEVLNRLPEADTLPLESAPELSPAADAPTFAPLPPMALEPRRDDVDEAMRRFARNFRRSAA